MTSGKEDNGKSSHIDRVLRLIVWLGASSGGVTLILTAIGFLVEHAYLDSLGVPRSLFEAKPTEYIFSGGNFLIALIPLAVLGLMHFVLNFWWFAIAILIASLVSRYLKLRLEIRLLAFAGLYGFWLFLILDHFARGAQATMWFKTGPHESLAVFTFTTIAAAGYLYSEIYWRMDIPAKRRTTASSSSKVAAAPLFLLVVCAFVALPYMRGKYGLLRKHPTIEILDHTWALTQDLKVSSSLCGRSDKSQLWQLIEAGKDRIILKCKDDGSILVVPANKITTFRILKGDK